jgi:hypothetical protein
MGWTAFEIGSKGSYERGRSTISADIFFGRCNLRERQPVTAIEIPGQMPLPVSEIWAALDEEMEQWDFEGS